MLNGSPYYANGFNAYWLMYTASDPSQRYKVSAAFREATSHGLTVARTWAFSDGGYRPLQYAPGFYNEQMFKVSLIIPKTKKGSKLCLLTYYLLVSVFFLCFLCLLVEGVRLCYI